MSSRLWFTSAILAILVFAGLGGCKPRTKTKPEVVRVARNLSSPYGSEMDLRIVEFQITNPRLQSGKPIVIQTVEIRDYRDLLQNHLGKDMNADVIILDAPEDAELNSGVKADMAHAVNICTAVKACPAEVPALVLSSASPDRKEAAQKFLDALQKPQ
ncbi:MAG TPA: hypothetical protein VII95_04985 [Terriglobales bacterium]|jgi:hypothetical protein